MKYQFSEKFLWGGACSGPQTEGYEGKAAESIWEYDFKNQPEKYFNGVGNLVASDFYHNYKEFIQNMKKAGIKSYRTSIQWSRILKDRQGTRNEEGILFYHKVLDELIANGIEPMICLFHFDMPMFYMERGGFESRETIDGFVEFAKVCFKEYGDKVHYWTTFNEPIVIAEQGYLYQVHYPEVVDMKRASQVAFHLQLTSSRTIQAFKEMGLKGEIGIILNLTPSYPPEHASEEDKKACFIADLIFNRSFLDPSVKGIYPKELIELAERDGFIPEYRQEDIEIIKTYTVDYLGVNYYTPRRVKARKSVYDKDYMMPERYYESYTFEGQKMNRYRGWEIYEKALYDIALNIRDCYGNIKWYVSENGMGVENEERFLDEHGQVQDDYRIEFIKEHLKYLHKGIQEGSKCFGYHLWAPFDNWSWRNAYKNRYGLIRVDIYDNCRQSLKKSAAWFKELSEQSGFDD